MNLEPTNPMMLHLVPRGKKLNKGEPSIAPGSLLESRLSSSSSSHRRSKPLALVLPLTPGFTIHSVCAFEKHEEIDVVVDDTIVHNGSGVIGNSGVGNSGGGGDGGGGGGNGGGGGGNGSVRKTRHTMELYTTAWESSAVSSGKVKGGLLGSWEGA